MRNRRFFFALLILSLLVPVSLHAQNADQAYQGALELDKLGRAQEALALYRKAIAINPDHWQAYEAMGRLLEREGQSAQALDAYTKSLRINPNNSALEQSILPLQRQEILRAVRPAEEGGGRTVSAKTYQPWRKKGVAAVGGVSSYSGKDAHGLKSSWCAGAGLFFDFGFKPRWELQPEVLLVRRGALLDANNATLEFFNIEVPVLLKFRLKETVHPLVGPRFAYVLSASVRVPNGQNLGVLSDAQILDMGYIAGLEVAAGEHVHIEGRLDRSFTSAFRAAQMKSQAALGGLSYCF